MRSRFLTFALVLAPLLAACGGSSANEPLLGTWTLDLDAMMERDEFKNTPAGQKKYMEGMLASMKVEITFTDDMMKTEVSALGRNESHEQSYTVESADGDKLVLASKDEDGNEEAVTVTVTGHTLTFTAGDDTYELKRK